jgi:hypothetical protein
MHEQAAHRVQAVATGFVLAAVDAVGDPDRLGTLTLEGELGGVLEDQDRALRRGKPLARRLEVAGQDLGLADALVGEEAVGGLGVGPVLAREGQAAADGAVHTLDQPGQALPQARVGEGAAGEFVLPP